MINIQTCNWGTAQTVEAATASVPRGVGQYQVPGRREKGRNHAWLVAVLLAASSLQVGCGSKPGSSGITVTGPTANSQADTVPETLRVLVLDDLPLADVIEREWGGRSQGDFEVVREPLDGFLNRLEKEPVRRLDTDVVIFPSVVLGQLVEQKLVRPIPPNLLDEPSYNRLEIYSQVRGREAMWADKSYAVSFGSPTLLLLTRPDIVTEGPPTTWQELSARVRSLRDRSTPDEVVPLLQPVGSEWASRTFLARAASYVFDSSRVSTVFDFQSLQPRIAAPPFVRALEELIADTEPDQRSSAELSPRDVLREFLRGRCAMAITWPSALADEIAPMEAVPFPVSISEIPGALEHFDFGSNIWLPRDGEESFRVTTLGLSGRLGSISLAAKNVTQAVRFLGWASGPEFSATLCARSAQTTLFRRSHAAQAELWLDRRLPHELATDNANVAASALSRTAWMHAPRIPGQHHYMQALNEAVHDAVSGKTTPAQALHEAATHWQVITEKLGIAAQIDAYQRSLGVATN